MNIKNIIIIINIINNNNITMYSLYCIFTQSIFLLFYF